MYGQNCRMDHKKLCFYFNNSECRREEDCYYLHRKIDCKYIGRCTEQWCPFNHHSITSIDDSVDREWLHPSRREENIKNKNNSRGNEIRYRINKDSESKPKEKYSNINQHDQNDRWNSYNPRMSNKHLNSTDTPMYERIDEQISPLVDNMRNA